MNKIEGVILDWAGTTVDFGCFAPVNVFIDIFKDAGVDVTMEEARAPMGLLKIDHIRAMLSMPRISHLWKERFGREFNEQDVEKLYAEFEPALMSSLAEYTDLIPEVMEAVQTLRSQGLKIGSTTGYTQSMMDVVVPNAHKKGYSPDFYITPDGTNSLGRPYPYMIYRNMEALKLSASWKVVKVGDTTSDIKEAVNAGVWSVGVIIGSSEMGLSLSEYDALSEVDQEKAISRTEQTFLQSGADFTIKTMGELPELIERINSLILEGKRPSAGLTYLVEGIY
ncbi:phosphonoacetaldehyde hydrolase [Heyndrickxia oleronia]|uniref:Phosphonoacetaldehyde hydrolase n=1 Tax=Heyndrickxia oleronia TaxID=38875 RepID=A0AAW6SXR2_9BACI|nr:phosphonoacetaldehyde hydrolase [Heyndrickxia oleronia]MCI1590219.1 phosphonoacetaldehyde hydrolase [Heyndrickxia oleronia]MCI1614001.1 phosphonoacetaldehyde hydrolase [Heyndrickxia oleronia]MCI1744348.1 phosphonoacetaldehyde hydrolase [Heyndrickxia oleronia]MCI1761862.1 phosphonoacetaldehyde hydrolase [Heyndrickxia oleronia]MDH5163644.1 phosphonoacetaldehyde hydrolase [Heyndrickxia oleronia]